MENPEKVVFKSQEEINLAVFNLTIQNNAILNTLLEFIVEKYNIDAATIAEKMISNRISALKNSKPDMY